MSAPRTDFVAGMRDVAPAVVGLVPFGVVTGIAAVDAGIPALQAVAMSAFVFAGASQVAASELIGQNAPVVVIVLTVLVINLRFVMLSASIAPYFERLSGGWKWLSAHLLVDVDYAVSIAKFKADEAVARKWYYLGTALPLWVMWVGASIVGIVLGAAVPSGLQLEFAIPLVFLTLLFSALDDRATQAAGLTAGVVSIPGVMLPFNGGLLVAAVLGVVAGLFAERRFG